MPIYIDEDTASLLAILLDDEYYNFMLKGRKTVDNLTVLLPEYLIPFKMIAWLDLTQRKKDGQEIDKKNIKKHRNDVFRLLQIVEYGVHIPIVSQIYQDIGMFITAMCDEQIPFKEMTFPHDKNQALKLLRDIYL